MKSSNGSGSATSNRLPHAGLEGCRSPSRIWTGPRAVLVTAWLMVGLAGCQSPGPTLISDADRAPDRVITLREGDVVQVLFAGTPTLNTTQQIRRDGNINLSLAGDVQAAGLTPGELEQAVLAVYGPQLLSREVSVTLQSTAFPIFVTGMVLRPGKIMSERPLTLLEGIMEAGGFDQHRANLKAIRILRKDGDQIRTIIVNLKPTLAGKRTPPFHLRPSDIVHVPERFTLF